jgi:hypothetical protein
MRWEIGEAGASERFAKHSPNGRCVAPMNRLNSSGAERPAFALLNPCPREDGIIWREKMGETKFIDPVKDNLREIVTQGIKIGVDALGEFRGDTIRLLAHQWGRFGQIDVPER